MRKRNLVLYPERKESIYRKGKEKALLNQIQQRRGGQGRYGKKEGPCGEKVLPIIQIGSYALQPLPKKKKEGCLP